MPRLALPARVRPSTGTPGEAASAKEIAVAVVVAVLATAAVVTAVQVWSLAVAGLGAAVVAGAVVLAVTRHRGIETVAVGLLTVAVAAAPANAVSIGGLPPGPGLLAVALACLVVATVKDHRPVRIPAWVWPLPATVVLVAALHLLSPTDMAYLAGRYLDGTVLSVQDLSSSDTAGALNAAQWLVSAVALPLAVCLATVKRPALPRSLAAAWALGSTASAAVAIADSSGATAISESLLGTVDVGSRQAGLTVQPNHLAVTAALGLTVVTWRMLRATTVTVALAWGSAGIVLVTGLVLTQSRGGLVVGLLSMGAVLLADRRARRLLPGLTGLGAATLVVLVALVPQLFSGVGEQLRFSGAETAMESDAIREAIAKQAVDDFLHDPVRGVGIEVLVQGHNIYLELLAGGGVVLLVGFALTAIGALLEAGTLRRQTSGLSALLGLCVATWLVGGLVENQVTDLYLYVPLALLAGLHAAAPRTTAPTSSQQMGLLAR